MGERGWRCFGISCAAGALVLAWARLAGAQPAAAAPASRYLYTTPYGASTNDPFDLAVAPVQNGPAGTVAVTPTAPPNAYSFSDFARNVHGYVSAGVATHDGHSFDGAVIMPLVPGKVDLSVAGATGQVGGLLPYAPGHKPGTAQYDAYDVTLHVHPNDNLDAYIGISGGQYRVPWPGSR